jgi:hypothetical protein
LLETQRMYRSRRLSPAQDLSGLVIIPITILVLLGWLSGLYAASRDEQWILFLIDFMVPPVGVMHGWGFIFGLW